MGLEQALEYLADSSTRRPLYPRYVLASETVPMSSICG